MTVSTTIEKVPGQQSPTETPPPKSRWQIFLLGSTLLWFFVCLWALDQAISSFRPLRYVQIPGIILRDQDPISEQVDALSNASDRRNVLLFGTSLLRCATSWADCADKQTDFSRYNWERYFRADTFDAMLKSKFGFDARSLSTSVGGGFFYDSWLLLNIALDGGRQPSLVVFTIAPKDFFDSTRTLDHTHLRICLDSRSRDVSETTDLPSAVNLMLTKAWRYFDLKSDYHTVAEVLTCSALNRPPSLFHAVNNHDSEGVKQPAVSFSFGDKRINPRVPIPAPERAAHDRYYESVYQSVKQDSFDQQFDFFDKALALCRQRAIPCLVINMPITALNRSQLPAKMTPVYLARLADISARHEAKLVDLMADKRFTDEDFRDSVHLNISGANKFWDILLKDLESDPQILSKMNTSFKK